jgi:hypothetical protein
MDSIALSFELAKKGGEWLATARSYLQNHCKNGSDITWGSHTDRVSLSPYQIEEMAARIAASAIVEYKEKLKAEAERQEKKRKVIEAGGIWID